MRISDRIGGTIAWGVVAAVVVGWIIIDGSSLGDALAVVAVGGVIVVLTVIIGNRMSAHGPLGRVNAVELAGANLIVRGDRGVRARRIVDGSVVQARSSVPDSTADDVEYKREVLYGDNAARLWLTGEHRRVLHGLPSQPGPPLELIDAELMVTTSIAARVEGFPILVRHRSSLAPDADHLVTAFALDGTVRWTASFPMLGLQNVAFLLADHERIVLVTSTREDGGSESIVLDAASGREVWRSRL